MGRALAVDVGASPPARRSPGAGGFGLAVPNSTYLGPLWFLRTDESFAALGPPREVGDATDHPVRIVWGADIFALLYGEAGPGTTQSLTLQFFRAAP